MSRRLTALAVLLPVVALGLATAEAAPKKKPKPIKGSYTVQLPPDPTKEGTSAAGEPGCSGLLPTGKHSKPFTMPAAGTLTVKLAGKGLPTGYPPAGLDWDLYLMEDGAEAAAANGPTGIEEAVIKVKKKTAITIDVCNLDGHPDAGISYTFVYK